MPFRRLSACFVLFVLFASESITAQGSAEDYKRSAAYRARTRNKVFRDSVRPHWLKGKPQFWYRVQTGPSAWRFIFVDAEKALRSEAFDHVRLAKVLAKISGKAVNPDNLPFKEIRFEGTPPVLCFTAFGKNWRCDLSTYQLKEVPAGKATDRLSAHVVPLDRIERTKFTGRETHCDFVNRTAGPVTLFWIDQAGNRRRYAVIAPGAKHSQHTYEGHVWLVVDAAGRPLAAFRATAARSIAVIDGSRRPRSPSAKRKAPPKRSHKGIRSPDGRFRAFIRDHNLVLEDLRSGEEWQLSSGGTKDDPYKGPLYWSPDSRKLVAMQVKAGQQRKIYLIESAPKDQLQPKLHAVDYLKPGDRIPHPRPRLFDIKTRSRIPISEELFPNPWSITELRWRPDSRGFTFLYNQRGHQVLRIVEVDAENGHTRAIIDERSKTFIDYAFKKFTYYLDATGEIIWMSERDGWNHLYLYDVASGSVKNQITRGPWVVRRVERVDEKKRQIWFSACGIYAGQDPYYVHLCRVNFDGTGLRVLTRGDGTHRWSFSPDRRFFVDTWSRVDKPPETVLRRSCDGELVCALEKADWRALLATGWRPPERFTAKGRDGKTDIYGIIVRPTTFDPHRKYPVIEKIYAGPQSAYVPKAFGLLPDLYEMAELGFIVVQIDGMGTSWRSKAFHDVCWKNLGDAGFPDRIRWLKAAASKHPEMDLTRVGIYGGSAGGQNALRALLAHGDFYHAAAADCGCHDNRMDKIWWNELWMGYPVGPHYAEQSNVSQAHRLKGKLLLTVGELDRNVDPASTMQVVDALIRANKDFELLVIPGAGHGAGELPYAKRRRADFFVRALWNVEPRWKRRSTP